MRDDDAWGTSSTATASNRPSKPRVCLPGSSIPLTKAMGDRVERRIRNGIEDLSPRGWGLSAISSLGDCKSSYLVTESGGAYHCTCYDSIYGDSRAAKRDGCSHVLAVRVWRERNEPAQAPETIAPAQTSTPDPHRPKAIGMPNSTPDPKPVAKTPDPDAILTPDQWATLHPPILPSTVPDWFGRVADQPGWPAKITALRPWQVDAIEAGVRAFRRGKKAVLIEAPTGAGKAQPLDELILTAGGFRPMGEIRVGDHVFDKDGTPVRVAGVFPQGVKPVVRVSFNDGTSVRCCEDHLWTVRRYDSDKWNVLATKDLVMSPRRNIYHVPVVKAIEFEAKDLPMNPYLLGLLLGNAGMKFAGLQFSTGDAFLVQQIEMMLPQGAWIDHRSGPDYGITTRDRSKSNPVTVALRNMGLQGCGSSSKFVPKEFLTGSIEQRAWLLRGIMDTDGHAAHHGGIDYVSASLQLCSDVEDLVRSLGGIARRGKSKIVKGVEYWRTYLKLPADMAPFHLPRKLEKWKAPGLYPCSKMIVAITHEGSEPCQCIAVESESHTYLTRDYIVTHNTAIGEGIRRLIGGRGNYVCTTKTLQDQFIEDFDHGVVLKGRANYDPNIIEWAKTHAPHRIEHGGDLVGVTAADCNHTQSKACMLCDETQFEAGEDPFAGLWETGGGHGLIGGQEVLDRGGGLDSSPFAVLGSCCYVKAKKAAERADLNILNTAYFIRVANSRSPRDGVSTDADGNMVSTQGIAGRKIVICDEADTLEQQIMGWAEVQVGADLVARHKIPKPDRVTVSEHWPSWIEEFVIPALMKDVESAKGDLEKSTGMGGVKIRRRIAGIVNKLESLELVCESIRLGGVWILDDYQDSRPTYTFKPVDVSEFGDMALWDHGEFFVLMSATFIDAVAYAKSIGLAARDIEVIKVPSSFPIQHRPVVNMAIAANTYKNKDHAQPLIARNIVSLARKHAGERVLVHSVSYEFTRFVVEELEAAGLDYPIITYDHGTKRQAALELYTQTPGAVAVAPSWDRGVDLPGDLCRVQIIAKVPFPSLGDKLVSAKMHGPGGAAWYVQETIRTLVQMVGRGCRSSDDWCWTYILDESFMRILRENNRFLPEFFRLALTGPGFAGWCQRDVDARMKTARY